MLFAALGYMCAKATTNKIGSYVHNSDKGNGIYYDSKNKLRYKGREVMRTYEDGDIVYRDIKNDRIYVNETIIWAKENEEKARLKGERFYLRQTSSGSSYNRCGNRSIVGNRFCEVGSMYPYYVIRDIEYVKNNFSYSGSYYMDMNYRFYCPTEKTDKRDTEKYGNNKESIQQEVICLLNKKMEDPIFRPNWAIVVRIGEPSKTEYEEACKKISRWT